MNNTVAPFFAIKTLDGKDIKLEYYRGKVVMDCLKKGKGKRKKAKGNTEKTIINYQ